MNAYKHFPHIDKLRPGSVVTLRFHRGAGYIGRKSNRAYDERAIFNGIEGKGNDRLAGFWTWDRDGRVFLWETYRFHGAWAYGTSAERLQLIAVEK